MRPNRLIVRAWLVRGVQLWLATRVLITFPLLLIGADPVRLSGGAFVLVVLLSTTIGFLDVHRRRERALLAHLTVRPLWLGLLFATPALVGECAVRLVGAVVP